jgi:nucleoid DNA-binding protein
MKKKDLIKKIAEEFDLDEIKVSEYFDNIFETLSVAFAKNKNINISEFGRFKVKTKLNDEGDKQRTVLFSPVKKFAYDINYNFNELFPIQIRVLDEKDKISEVEYSEDEVEEILLIDFEEAQIEEIEKAEEILIPEEPEQVVPSKEETEKPEEEILIPEETVREVSGEIILEEIAEETKEEVITKEVSESIRTKDETYIEEISVDVIDGKNRILGDFATLKIPEIKFEEYDERIELPEIISKDKKVISEIITTVKLEEAKEEIISEIPEIKEEIISEIPEIKEEEKIEEPELIREEEPTLTAPSELEAGGIEEKTETPKTSLELEQELLKMLDERKKILDEIKKLEEVSEDDLVDINKPQNVFPEEKPILFEESTLDISKQNIFVDESGKVLENLLKDFEKFEEKPPIETEETSEIISEPAEEEKIIPEIKDEHIEEIKKDVGETETSENIFKEFEVKDNIEEVKYTDNKDIGDLESLFGSVYGEKKEETVFSEPINEEPQLNNQEMKIFDKLLDDTIQQEEKGINVTGNGNQDLKSFNELENMFVSFKTEKDENAESPSEEIVTPIKKTETIKTYDDIFNLIEPNGKKKEEKPNEITKKESLIKKYPLVLKIIVPLILLLIIIFISVFIYQRAVKKLPVENPQTQVAPADSTNKSLSDSVIYADTNKTEAAEEEVMFDENGFVIKHSEKGFFVQFGNFENQFELAKKIKELKEKNIIMEYEKETKEGKEIYKIKAGPYKSLREAKSIIPKL